MNHGQDAPFRVDTAQKEDNRRMASLKARRLVSPQNVNLNIGNELYIEQNNQIRRDGIQAQYAPSQQQHYRISEERLREL